MLISRISILDPCHKSHENLKINLDEEKNKPDFKPKGEEKIKTKPDVKPKKEPDINSKKEGKLDVEMIKNRPDMNRITYEEEKVALVLRITSIFTVWWMFK